MEWISVTLFICLTTLIFWFYIGRRPKNLPPGPLGLPIVGYLPFLGKYPFKTLMKLGHKYGKVFLVPLGNSSVLVLNDWSAIKEALVKQSEIFIGRPKNIIFEELIHYEDIILADGPGWKERRRFTLHHLKDLGFGKSSMESIIMDEIQKLSNNLKVLHDKDLQINDFFIFHILNITWSIVGGKTYHNDDTLLKEIMLYLKTLSFESNSTNSLMYMPYLIHFFPIQFERLKSVTRRMNQFLEKEIDDHVTNFHASPPRDFIDIYLTEIFNKEKLAEETLSFKKSNLIEITKDLFAAGIDTSNNTICWALLYMATWPNIQQKVQQELDKVVGRDQMPSYQHRPSLPYAEAVMSEVYRFSSILPMAVLHATTADTKLFDYTVPKGTAVIPNLWAVHRDPNYWEDPNVFRPERFLTSNGEFKKPEYLIPFGVGGRACLGESLARLSNFLFFTCLLHQFSFSHPPGQEWLNLDPIYATTLAPHPFSLRIRQR